jgi:phosphoglycerol transferase MdoB-like AlkP superfamily enzyme
VTRGAQEAVFCSYIGSRDSSLMRGSGVTKVDCLPRIIGPEGDTFWFHGGEGRFDGQLNFWNDQEVKHTISLKDFPSSSAKTSWGVGDQTFFKEALKRLDSVRQTSSARYLLGLILSVTNHIPWMMPDDAPSGFAPPGDLKHPSYLTTAYTDAALGDFIDGLKSLGLWQDLFLIVSSDHGNMVPPMSDIYPADPLASAKLMSHINLLLIGGIVESALESVREKSLHIDHVVSQADIASLIADLVGIRNRRLFSDHPLAPVREIPVISILEESVFSPETGEVWSRQGLSRGTLMSANSQSQKTMLYYRAFLQFLGMPTPLP